MDQVPVPKVLQVLLALRVPPALPVLPWEVPSLGPSLEVGLSVQSHVLLEMEGRVLHK